MSDLRWGVVATARAPLATLRAFAAWHLHLGAHRVYLYLDDADPGQRAALNSHPRLRVRLCDTAYWQRSLGHRPARHQLRQGRNAAHCAARAAGELDWLAHIDVDEMILPAKPQITVAASLAALKDTIGCARLRPVEALASPPGAAEADAEGAVLFKACPADAQERLAAARRLYPRWAHALPGGFLSHVAGKLFFRPSLADLDIRIHNIWSQGVMNPGQSVLTDLELGHFHAPDWQSFRAHLGFRLDRGSYRAELKPQVRATGDAPNLHRLLTRLMQESGDEGLRRLFDEVAVAHPALRRALAREGLLRRHEMPLDRLASEILG